MAHSPPTTQGDLPRGRAVGEAGNWQRIETDSPGPERADRRERGSRRFRTPTRRSIRRAGNRGLGHGGADADKTAPLEVLPSIVDAVAGRAAVLVDGGFRRGAMSPRPRAFGAKGVLLARPIMWGLRSYGADGVRTVLELLQNDLARNMGRAWRGESGKALTRAMVRVHRR